MTAGYATPGGHTPVMLKEVLEVLAPRDGGIYVDGTFGAGGYSRALLDAANCRVWGIDRDKAAVARGLAMAEPYGGRLTVLEGRFGELDKVLAKSLPAPAHGVTFDLGVSSMQLDMPERGFSFRSDGPLDMRMEGSQSSRPSAADVVRETSEQDLADIIFRYGEERKSRQIARAIVTARKSSPITRTLQLARIVRGVVGRGAKRGIDPATRTFQALRIHVNDEIEELRRGLDAAERLLAPGGRLAVVSFHSLEDRIAKSFIAERSGSARGASRHSPITVAPCELAGEGRSPTFTAFFRGARKASKAECRENPRARSARLRAAERTSSAAASGGESSAGVGR